MWVCPENETRAEVRCGRAVDNGGIVNDSGDAFVTKDSIVRKIIHLISKLVVQRNGTHNKASCTKILAK